MKRLRSSVASVLVALAVLATPFVARDARADDPPSPERVAQAAKLKDDADKLMSELRYADAYAIYAQAYELNADPAILYNQGRALQAMGDYPESLDRLERFRKYAPADVRAKVPDLDGLIAEIKKSVGTLVLRCNVPRAAVLLRAKALLNGCDGHPVGVRSGLAILDVLADGYEPFKSSVEVPAGKTVTLDVNLVEKARVAMVAVRVSPEGALVLADGKPLGPAPVEAKLAPGPHTLVVQQEGHEDETVPITLDHNEKRTIDLRIKETPVTARWWFWAGLGVALVGGGAAGYAVGSAK